MAKNIMTELSAEKKNPDEEIRDALKSGRLYFEKCEISEAKIRYNRALELAKQAGNTEATVESLVGLLRFSAEALDKDAIADREKELDSFLEKNPGNTTPSVWYCKGVIAAYLQNWLIAQRHFHRFLREVRKSNSLSEKDSSELEARGLVCLADVLRNRGFPGRSELLAHVILNRFENKKPRGAIGSLYVLLGTLASNKKDTKTALNWHQKAHASFLEERNWYYYLYVLLGYARIFRIEKNYGQAAWYLELVERTTKGSEFGVLPREVKREYQRIEEDAVDLLIETQSGYVKTRLGKEISLRKQYVLMDMLKALGAAHSGTTEQNSGGLSKSEIINSVWKESYRPEAHDNKLYYNINRLRKLIEPDVRKPQYLLNWKEGYRLAPGLRVKVIEASEKLVSNQEH